MINLENLTEEQRKELERQLKAEQEEKEKLRKEKIEEYKNLVDECVMKGIQKARYISEMIANGKKEIQDTFKILIDLKEELYGIRDNQQSHSFSTRNGNYSITVGYRVVDNFDDTVHTGIAKAKSYINRILKDENKELQKVLDLLLKKDKNGNLKASRVIELERIALDINDDELTEGVRIIKEAWKPQKTKTFIEASYKDENGNRINIPLSVTGVGEENERNNSTTNKEDTHS
ncbi:MAG: DUF3164 family protein [Fusobacterium gastrosuis]|uniref:DUF3164 family protein n=1 Tax=Fusobacterium gastrosuis TaxID=1755100 RepID=UPI002A858819|nr:DUF3164 family protein [Fusobacterium gastrosuis]